MKKYLDPKADLTFKKVFGEHKELVISFLNAMLPFESEEEEIKSVEYLNPELVPLNPLRKDSIVDVRCKDSRDRQFIVEMQMMWTPEYKQRVLFNASKAYVSQLGKKRQYKLLQPVYSLNLVNDTFSDSKDYYHDYRIVEMADTREVIEGLRFIFIELPKFTPKSFSEKRMQILWLRYLTEIDENTSVVPQELLDTPEIGRAVEELEESAFSENELLSYEHFWDMIGASELLMEGSVKRGLEEGLEIGIKEGIEKGLKKGMKKGMKEGMREGMKEGIKKGIKEGMEKGLEKGIKIGAAEGEERGRRQERIKNAAGMIAAGIPVEKVMEITGLTPEETDSLSQQQIE